jgi:Bacterial conjugation TrbI-like protein
MLSNRLAFAALAIACLGAAAGGGYLATRQNTVPTPASAQGQTTAAVAPAAAPSSAVATPPGTPAAPATAVHETEGVIGDTAPRTPAAPPKTSAARPIEPPARAGGTRESRPATAAIAHHEPPPVLANSWPSSPAPQPPSPAPASIENASTAPRADERAVQEPVRPVDPPQRTFAELVVSADSVIGLQTENRISSETARVEDRVEARVTRDVRVGERVAIPAGARAIGSVTQVDRGGKFKERARLGIRFHTLVLADGTRIPIATDTIYREGEPPSNSSPAKVGGAAVGGAILGAILGGGKGAMIGAAAGAGAGTAVVAAGDRNAATLPAGSSMTVRILQPITITTEDHN